MKLISPKKKIAVYLALFSTFVALNSCGYKPTEDDKYPDLTVFPQLADSSFLVTKFPNENYSIVGFHHNLLYVQYDTPRPKGSAYYNTGMFATLNRSYEEVTSFGMNTYSLKSDEYGNLYIIGDSLRKYSYPNFKPTGIKYFPNGSSEIWSEFADTMDYLSDKDPNFDSREFAGEILEKRIRNFKPGSKKSYIKYMDHIILFFDNEEYYELDYLGMDLSFMEMIDDWEFPTDNEDVVKKKSKKLIFFDDAGLETQSTGNHYTVSFYQSGLDYFHLVMEGDSTTFKHPNKRVGGGGSLLEVQSFDKPDEVLLLNENGELYLVKHR